MGRAICFARLHLALVGELLLRLRLKIFVLIVGIEGQRWSPLGWFCLLEARQDTTSKMTYCQVDNDEGPEIRSPARALSSGTKLRVARYATS